MKKFLKVFAILLVAICTLVGCSNENVPEGLSKMNIRDGEGFTIYCPEGWTDVSAPFNEHSYVYAARFSTANRTAFTFVEGEMPEGEISEYFDESLNELSDGMRETLTVLSGPEDCNFGNADEAKRYVYTYKYSDYDYTESDYVLKDFSFMQIFVKHSGRFFIFTYTAEGLATDEASEYSKHVGDIQLVIDNFTISDGSSVNTVTPEYEKDEDGYNLVSDKTLCGFELYLPDSYTVIDNNGDVEAKISSGASLSLTTATQTGAIISDYWNLRKLEIGKFASNLVEIEVNRINKSGEDISVVLGDLDAGSVASYEYTYVYNGVTYHVYQVMGVDSWNGYVFTYTATESEYESHLETIKTILEKVRF